jgi:hypothetical protein
MKRTDADVDSPGRSMEVPVGLPARHQTVGLSGSRGSRDQSANRQARRDPVANALAEAALIEDFLEFLEGESDIFEVVLPLPDPDFRERLRRRLWRSWGLSRLQRGRDLH